MWERYCRGVNAIVYMVDAADHEKIDASKNELHNLLEKPQLAGIPILVLGNKRDLEGALDENGLIERLNLRAVQVKFQFSLNQAKNSREYLTLLIGSITIQCCK